MLSHSSREMYSPSPVPLLGGEEGFENVVQLLGGDAGPIVEDLNDRQIAGFVAKQAEPDLSAIVLLAAVAQAVLHQVGEHLGQLVGVHARLQRAADGFQVNRLLRAEPLAELADEAMQPVFEIQQLGLAWRRRESCSTFSMTRFIRREWSWMICASRRSGPSSSSDSCSS